MQEIMTYDAFIEFEALVQDREGRVIPDYSGRGMFGQTCLAVSCSGLGHLLEIVREVTRSNPDDLLDGWLESVGNVRSDNLGMDTVYYWTGIACESEPTEDEEDSDDE